MKFAMGAGVLSTLAQKTSASTDDLGALVRELAAAAEPLEGKFNGAGRAAFDRFRARTEQIALELDAALASVLAGIGGMDRAFTEGDQAMADETRSAESNASFSAARFSTGR